METSRNRRKANEKKIAAPRGGTHLNICAILSKLEKHDKARPSFGRVLLESGRVARAEIPKQGVPRRTYNKKRTPTLFGRGGVVHCTRKRGICSWVN